MRPNVIGRPSLSLRSIALRTSPRVALSPTYSTSSSRKAAIVRPS